MQISPDFRQASTLKKMVEDKIAKGECQAQISQQASVLRNDDQYCIGLVLLLVNLLFFHVNW